ncbi:MAG: helix-turn-helix transcriptional regulator [Planctomyces sp.]|nr:helix-turn-helix transcriptional regulator [Planctomyces sp.]
MAKKAAKKTATTAAKRKPVASATIREVILQAIEDRGESVLALSKLCGVSQPQLSRFVSGERDLRLESAAKLCEALGLELRKIVE